MRSLFFLVLPLTFVSCGLFFGSSTSDNKGEFQNILGSDRGWYIKEREIEVLLDAKIGALRIRHVKMNSNICISGEIHHIEMDGPIGPDSSEAMKKLLENIPKCMNSEGTRYVTKVYMNSGGGLLEDGYEMGRLFRKVGVKGVITSGQRCASSCAIAFLGSNFRAMFHDAEILFHAPYTKISERTIDCSDKREKRDLKRYFVFALNEENGNFLHKRTMDYCSNISGWVLNADGAKLFGITNSE